ncbi:MAG: Txe/YoeB family addiction module toxin [Bifidobacteriaceae bacterium]|jgi:toxin YoeB|nr:Txe/YoeB family addiction module toxin [Bifidobacteriaceae bacterium]
MRIIWQDAAWADYTDWAPLHPAVHRRINALVKDVARQGVASGIGKPEPLRFEWSEWWSRRIDSEHRLVYRVTGPDIEIAAVRYHY